MGLNHLTEKEKLFCGSWAGAVVAAPGLPTHQNLLLQLQAACEHCPTNQGCLLRCVRRDTAPWWEKATHEPELAYRAKSASPSPLFPSCILRVLKYLTEWFRHQSPAGLRNSVSEGTSVPRTGFQSAIITAFYQNMTAALKHFTVKLYNSKPRAWT